MFPSLYQTANIFAHNFKSLAWTRPSLLLQGGNPVSLPSWHPDSPPHPGAWSLPEDALLIWTGSGALGTAKTAPGTCHQSPQFSPLSTSSSSTNDRSCPSVQYTGPYHAYLPPGDALHRTAPAPTPPRQAPKAPSCSRARGFRPRESDPPLGSRRARWQQAGRAARAPGSRGCLQSGAVLTPLPFRARPVPKEDTPPPVGPLPTLGGAASPARPRRPPAPPAASERGERSGMGLGGSGQGGDSGSASGFFPGSHKQSPRGEPWLSERRRGQRGRPGRLRPCLAS